MKPFKFILFPFAAIYWLAISIRNLLYDVGIFKSPQFQDIFLLCVGNLAVGGSGKSPLVEYLISFLSSRYKVAILSRGYKRNTKGFVLASSESTANDIGDEPMQIWQKFSNIQLAVCEDRVEGVKQLLNIDETIQVVILDDAFQHRKIKPDFSIIVSEYFKPFFKDFLLPVGFLRESRSGLKRANMLLFSKCGNELEKQYKNFNLPTFFTKISYGNLYDLIFKEICEQPKEIVLVTGIVDPNPLKNYLEERSKIVKHFNYPDHYNYTSEDVQKIRKPGRTIITTEKDAVKLQKFEKELKRVQVLVQPIKNLFVEQEKEFQQIILDAIDNKIKGNA